MEALKGASALFIAALIAIILEGVEIYMGTCNAWFQELLLLTSLLIISATAIHNKSFSYLASIMLLGFYGYEFYEQYFEGEICSANINEINILLFVLIIASLATIRWNKSEC